MEFDLFDKLSELETKLQILEGDIETRDILINQLKSENQQLREKMRNMTSNSIIPPGTDDCDIDKFAPNQKFCDTSESPNPEILFSMDSEKSLADQLREASDSVTRSTGYVFDQKTGLYYDHNSGYYYDPDNQLFFEPRNGIYYSYNTETRQYKFQSRISAEELQVLLAHNNLKAGFESVANNARLYSEKQQEKFERKRKLIRYSRSRSRSSSSDHSRRKSHKKKHRKHKEYRSRSRSCSRSRKRSRSFSGKRSRRQKRRSSSTSSSYSEKQQPQVEICSSAVKYPPVLRLIVLSSKFYRTGKLSIVTAKEAEDRWATIGKSRSLCPVLYFERDDELDEIHSEIVFNREKEIYLIKDKRTKAGTYLNGEKLEKPSKHELKHGDILRIGFNKILVHIHDGTETCEQCIGDPTADEPIFIEAQESNDLDGIPLNADEAILISRTLKDTSREDIESQRKANIKALKEKYGLVEDITSRTDKLAKGSNNQYKDRAANRRKGAFTTEPDNQDLPRPLPPLSLVEKHNKASVDKPISVENKGAKLLSKMGWTPGSGLGKDKSGISEPIRVDMRKNQFAGLGSNLNQNAGTSCFNSERVKAVTLERYQQATTDSKANS